MEQLLQQYSADKAKMNALYALYQDYRGRVESWQSQIIEEINVQPLSEEDLLKAIKSLYKHNH